MGKTPQELYEEREKRVKDAVALKTPDRVPVVVSMGFLPARYSGMTIQEIMYDPDIVGKDGGYIMDASTGLDDAKLENVKAMFEFTREYGVY